MSRREQLTAEAVQELGPRYLFFMHWSWIVPDQIVQNYECVCFHMADVPYGRGGSPLQNLVLRGHRSTKLSALRMTKTVDAGPVYLKEPLCLEGNAEQIYIRASNLCAEMIAKIVRENPTPLAQHGDGLRFRRRRPEESEIPESPTMEAVYDFIRMLDAEEYPKAFLIHHGYRYEFTRASLYDGRIKADVTIAAVPSEKR